MANKFRVKLIKSTDLGNLNDQINEFMERSDIKYIKSIKVNTTRETTWWAQINYIVHGNHSKHEHTKENVYENSHTFTVDGFVKGSD